MDKKDLQSRLDLIKEMMNESTRSVVENGLYFMAFSMFSVIGTIFTYVLFYFNLYSVIPWFWVIFWPIITVLIITVLRKKGKSTSKSNILQKLMIRIWFFLTGLWVMIILLYLIITKTWSFSFVFSLGAFVLGGGFFLNSLTILKGNLLKISGILWWAVGIGLAFIPNQYIVPLCFAGFQIIFQFVPGLIYYKNYKKGIKG